MNEQDIPIEITAPKLLEWLESRKIVSKNWQTQIREIRTKISNALNDMPVHDDLVRLLSGSYINYFHCLEIIEILKKTEADTKSLFGRYGSQRMTDWQQIVKLYEKDSVYLAEAGQIIQRNNSEVPSLRKQRKQIGQLIDDTQQRTKDLIKTEENLFSERNATCQQLGIKGVNLKEEFLARIKELPRLYENIAKHIPKITKSLEFYAEFSGNNENLPLIQHISKNGNTTVYQFVYNEAPLSVEEAPIRIYLSDDSSSNDNEIDFGDAAEIDFGSGDNDAIDFGDIGVENVTLETGDIDWGEPAAGPIDEISLEESGIVVADSGLDGGVARGNEAYTLLDSLTYRDQFIDELYELEAFLQMRQFELKSEQSNSFLFSLIDVNSKHDLDSVSAMLTEVQSILVMVSSDVLDHLHRLKHSPKYANILAGKLKQSVLSVEKSRATRELLKSKIVSLNEEKASIRPIVKKLIESTKQIQGQVEKDISKRYKGRPVTLYGGIDFDPSD